MTLASRGPSPAVASRRATALTVALAVVAIPFALLADGDTGSLLWLAVLAAVVTVAELRPVHVARNGQRHSFTLTEGPLVAALALAPGRWIVVAIAAGVLLAQVLRRLPHYKVAFNVAQFGLATGVATVTAQTVGGSLGVALGVAAFTLVNDSVVRVVIALTTGRAAGRPLQDTGLGWLLHVAAVSSIALLGAHVFLSDAGSLPAFIAPALLVLWSQEQSNKRRARSTVVQALAAQAGALYGRSSEESALLLARTAREVLAAARTELVLLGDDSIVVLTTDATGVHRSRLSHAELITGWRGRVFESATATASGGWAGAVVGREVPRALLGIWREEGQEEFRSADVDLLQTLSDTVGEWLSITEQEGTSLLDLRRRVADLGDDAKGMADALGMLAAIRAGLDTAEVAPSRAASLAADLRDVENRIASFASALMAEARCDSTDGIVATGQWGRSA